MPRGSQTSPPPPPAASRPPLDLRHRVAAALAAAGETFVSGEALAATLEVSRAAVGKHVAALRTRGFLIEAAPRRGYRLLRWPDSLEAEAVVPLLRSRRLGWPYQHLPTCESTNAALVQAGLDGAPHGTTVTAEAQTGGRGRRGRRWHSPPGAGLYVSILLRPELAPPEAPPLTLVAAVATAEALSEATGLEPRVKWPNDLLIHGRKCTGILLEMNAEPERVHFVVVGVGINVRAPTQPLPPELQETATSLEAALTAASGETSSPTTTSGEAFSPQPSHWPPLLSRPHLLALLLTRLETWTERYVAEGFGPVREAWIDRAAYLGEPVTVVAPDATWHGVALDVDERGALRVQRPDGSVHAVLAGDVTLRPGAPSL